MIHKPCPFPHRVLESLLSIPLKFTAHVAEGQQDSIAFAGCLLRLPFAFVPTGLLYGCPSIFLSIFLHSRAGQSFEHLGRQTFALKPSLKTNLETPLSGGQERRLCPMSFSVTAIVIMGSIAGSTRSIVGRPASLGRLARI